MNPSKACPVVLRARKTEIEVLAFRHPLGDLQIIKGTIEPFESPQAAAIRELEEESGISSIRGVRHLGDWESGFQGQVWSFHHIDVPYELPETWSYQTKDDEGHTYHFFWHPLDAELSQEWHELFVGALGLIRSRLNAVPIFNTQAGSLAAAQPKR